MTDFETNFVTIYFVTREYGGPEEGGWWFNNSQKVLSFDVRGFSGPAKDALYYALESYYARLEGASNLYSVTSTGEHEVVWEEEEGELETTERPRYE